MHARPDISQRLADTLGPGQIVAYFQPKFGLDMQLKGVEALARWRCHDGQILTPNAFLSGCAERGLQEELTLEMITQACEIVGAGCEQRDAPAGVSINLTSHCVISRHVFDHLRQTARRCRVAPEQITIEILEDALEQPTDMFLFALERYRCAGFRLSIDDFGTCAAGLRRLIEFQADEVKIARYFISGVSKDTRKMALVKSVVALANQLDMDTVIEGVEDQDDLAWCRGLDEPRAMLQGFALARPMPPSLLPLSLAAVVDRSIRKLVNGRNCQKVPASPPIARRGGYDSGRLAGVADTTECGSRQTSDATQITKASPEPCQGKKYAHPLTLKRDVKTPFRRVASMQA